jgi:magnesium transporter
MMQHVSSASSPVTTFIRRDPVTFKADLTVDEAIDRLRKNTEKADHVLYFYIEDAEGRLVGVVPVRRLLISEPQTRLESIMVTKLVTLDERATLEQACEVFVRHRFLSLPVVNAQGRLVGVVDATKVNDEMIDLTKKQASDEMFERIGLRLDAAKDASISNAFGYRFPWLTATLISGLLCALLASLYEATLAQSLALSFFLTLVLGLGESVSMQSMTVTIQQLRLQKPSLQWALFWFPRELITALLLGTACGGIVMLIVSLWRPSGREAFVLGGSICLAIVAACLIGRLIPFILHAWRLDPKVSAGPLTLGLADILTLTIYFNTARALLS